MLNSLSNNVFDYTAHTLFSNPNSEKFLVAILEKADHCYLIQEFSSTSKDAHEFS